ncbi:hypothetical protein Dimus_006998 [Dionaea muscipula]
MAEAILFNIASELLKNLGSKALEEIAAAGGFKDQLEKLKDTANTIKDVLSDAEQRQEENKAVRGWLEKLRSVVYDADDLFDEFSTMVTRKESMAGSTISKEVRLFFSSSNPAAFAYKMARQVKEIRERLDAIAKDGDQFTFRPLGNDIGQALSCGRRRQTYSYVDADEVIGRDEDKKAIVEMLMLDPNVGENISVLSIVGIGGLGKTTLAQFVYNDEQIQKHFELKLWVCVSDVFDIKVVIEKILMSATSTKPQDVEIDQLQTQLRRIIGGKNCLLVLDDLWNENRDKWLELKALLKVGRMGSKILVTSRSKRVAKMIAGTTPPYELKGLSEEKSWLLFERMAFETGQQQLYPNLVEVGKKIVKKCADVPLAIRTLGGLLYGREESVWISFKENELAKIPEGGNNIITILKISYHQLWSPLKNCFAYCALYPKDYEMYKETLISLWMAEGFITPSYEGQSLEEAGEMYFLTLLQSCFFQEITRDEWGGIKSCKMHDLMHDLAQEVAGTETIVAKLGMGTFDKRARHLSFGYRLSLTSKAPFPTSLFELKHLRTFLLPGQVKDGGQFNKSICHQIFSSFNCLRVLDLHNLGIKSLASSIGNLVHLRYLDLSFTLIKALPASITKLQNLLTLKLHACHNLKTLPMDIRKLINLRHLDVSRCYLTRMPAGIGTLTNLHKLDEFVVGSRKLLAAAHLRDLNALAKLRGKLHINIRRELEDPAYEAKEANLGSKFGLTELYIEGKWDYLSTYDNDVHDQAVLDGLQPHPNLKKLEIQHFRGQRPPIWASMDNLNSFLPKLVEVSLRHCFLKNVPLFHRLRFLKRLRLAYLESVEYMESGNYEPPSSSSSSSMLLFFPSLEELTLICMDKLKGWWMEVEVENNTGEEETVLSSSSTATSIEWWQQHKQLPLFPRLRRLRIHNCPNLKSMPLCPDVEELELVEVNKELVVMTSMVRPIEYPTADATSSSSFQSAYSNKVKALCLDDVDTLLSLPADCIQHLSSLDIRDPRVPDLSALGEVFTSLSSLRSLEITFCHGLRSLSGGLEHLSSLEKMAISDCQQLDLSAGMPWKALKGLRSLTLHLIYNMLVLPDGLQHLTTLRSLEISYNFRLTAIPEWINCLTSLEFLEINYCDKVKSLPEGIRLLTSLKELIIRGCSRVLTERCRGPNGDDWPKIQHIPVVKVLETW